MVGRVPLLLAWKALVRVPAHLGVPAFTDVLMRGHNMSTVYMPDTLRFTAAMTAQVVLHVATMRFELMTSPLWGERSNQLSYAAELLIDRAGPTG